MRCKLIYMAGLLPAALASASSGAWEITEPKTIGFSLTIDEHNRSEIEQGFRLTYRDGVDSLADSEIKSLLLAKGLKTPAGDPVTGLAIDRSSKTAVATSDKGTNLSIVSSKQTGDRHDIIVSGANKRGLQFVLPETVGAFTLDGAAKPYSAVPFSAAKSQTLRVAILLDVSGSMKGSQPNLKKATRAFLTELADINPGILCRITSFTDTHDHSGRFVPCDEPGLQRYVDGLRAGGKTDIERPLLDAYRTLGKYDDSSTVLIITDGKAPVRISQLLAAKSSATHALWLGDSFRARKNFRKLIDTSLFRSGDVVELAQSFYGGFSLSLKKQLVISVPANQGNW